MASHGYAKTDPRHVEPVAVDTRYGFITKWYCDPPPEGTVFITRDRDNEWQEFTGEDGTPVVIRKIYAWRAPWNPLVMRSY